MKIKILLSTLLICLLITACHFPRSAKKRRDAIARQKRIVYENCLSEKGYKSVYSDLNYLSDEPKSVSEKKFLKYIESFYPIGFPFTSTHFILVFQPDQAPCLREVLMVDTLKMNPAQLDYLTKAVLDYPVFREVQFKEGEKAKFIRIVVSRFRKSKLQVGFL